MSMMDGMATASMTADAIEALLGFPKDWAIVRIDFDPKRRDIVFHVRGKKLPSAQIICDLHKDDSGNVIGRTWRDRNAPVPKPID